jgi:hypothetical protein
LALALPLPAQLAESLEALRNNLNLANNIQTAISGTNTVDRASFIHIALQRLQEIVSRSADIPMMPKPS